MRQHSKPTVVAVNDQQPSALLFALQESRAFASPLRVVSAYGVPAEPSQDHTVGLADLDERRMRSQRALDGARQLIEGQADLPEVEYVLLPFPPVEALLHEAEQARALVVGADDVPWIERSSRTKIAGHLAAHARCPVFVVPRGERPARSGGEVVVTVDGVTSPTGALHVAFEEAHARDRRLHVLHATPPGTLLVDAEASRSNLHDVLDSWRAEYPGVPVLEADCIGDAPAALSRASEGADLVVVGRPRSNGAPFALLLPAAAKVLKAARCPLVVVPVGYQA